MKPNLCPTDVTLGHYSTGDLSEAEAETINEHVAACATCLDKLHSLNAHPEPFIAALRIGTAPVPEIHPALARVVSALLNGDIPSLEARPPEFEQGSSLKGYCILEELGRGGMGRVYRATHPRLKQEVALKVLRRGMDSAPIIARFEAERQTLALMDHPHIARVSDGGVTEDGRPFFVMELVRGVALTHYCDDHRLPIRDRLELFLQVCRAVQHAHQKGIIHRDLKPSNVLVAEYDGKPLPKVIDFGVAKAVEPQTTVQTEVGMLVGTPEYMSPEQADLTSQDIDTRSDVYALGVLLYELLTGDTPFCRERLRAAHVLEVLRIIRQEDPVAPSTRLKAAMGIENSKPSEFDRSVTNTCALDATAARRGTEPNKLVKLVKGDLDWIVLKALEKDRSRRYETASAFADDVQRYLANEPVLAGPPTARYRIQKYLRRNRGPVLAATVVIVALVGGMIGTTIQWVRANRERDDKVKALEEVTVEWARANRERDDKIKALDEANQANRKARDSLRTLTDDVVARVLGRQVRLSQEDRAFVRKILGEYEALADLKGDGEESRAIRADGNLRQGALRVRLGENTDALASYERAIALYQDLVVDFPAQPEYRKSLADGHTSLGRTFHESGKRARAETEYLLGRAVYMQLVADFPAQASYRQALAISHDLLGILKAQMGQPEEAEREIRSAIRLKEDVASLFPDRADLRHGVGMSHVNFGPILKAFGKLADAEAEYKNGLAVLIPLVAEYPAVPDYREGLGVGHYNLGFLLTESKKFPEAEAEYHRALGVRKHLAAEFPAVPTYREKLATVHNGLGRLFWHLKRYTEAEAEYTSALVILKQLTVDFPNVADYAVDLGGGYYNVGLLLQDTGKPKEALDWFGQAVQTLTPAMEREPRLANGRQFLLMCYSSRADALVKLDRHAEAIEDWDRALKLDDGVKRIEFRLKRAACLARIEPEAAVIEAEEVVKAATPSPETLYSAARVISVASEQAKTTAQREQYTSRAVELLRLAGDRGHFKQTEHQHELEKNSDFDPLRNRKDFQQLLVEVAAAAPDMSR